jgi:hypothetical protein
MVWTAAVAVPVAVIGVITLLALVVFVYTVAVWYVIIVLAVVFPALDVVRLALLLVMTILRGCRVPDTKGSVMWSWGKWVMDGLPGIWKWVEWIAAAGHYGLAKFVFPPCFAHLLVRSPSAPEALVDMQHRYVAVSAASAAVAAVGLSYAFAANVGGFEIVSVWLGAGGVALPKTIECKGRTAGWSPQPGIIICALVMHLVCVFCTLVGREHLTIDCSSSRRSACCIKASWHTITVDSDCSCRKALQHALSIPVMLLLPAAMALAYRHQGPQMFHHDGFADDDDGSQLGCFGVNALSPTPGVLCVTLPPPPTPPPTPNYGRRRRHHYGDDDDDNGPPTPAPLGPGLSRLNPARLGNADDSAELCELACCETNACAAWQWSPAIANHSARVPAARLRGADSPVCWGTANRSHSQCSGANSTRTPGGWPSGNRSVGTARPPSQFTASPTPLPTPEPSRRRRYSFSDGRRRRSGWAPAFSRAPHPSPCNALADVAALHTACLADVAAAWPGVVTWDGGVPVARSATGAPMRLCEGFPWRNPFLGELVALALVLVLALRLVTLDAFPWFQEQHATWFQEQQKKKAEAEARRTREAEAEAKIQLSLGGSGGGGASGGGGGGGGGAQAKAKVPLSRSRPGPSPEQAAANTAKEKAKAAQAKAKEDAKATAKAVKEKAKADKAAQAKAKEDAKATAKAAKKKANQKLQPTPSAPPAEDVVAAGSSVSGGGGRRQLSGRLLPVAEESIRPVPNTSWGAVVPPCSCADFLRGSAAVRAACPRIDAIAADCATKAESLRWEEGVPAALSEDELVALAAYSHSHGAGQAGNLYFELNNALRRRGKEDRAALIAGWGVYMHYIMGAMAKLPRMEGVCYRGYPDKATAVAQYKVGRPIQWGAFTSTSTNFGATAGFTNQASGVIFKIAVTDGRDINAFSFFPQEAEVLLSPEHRFHVSSAPYERDGYTIIDMVQDAGNAFVS